MYDLNKYLENKNSSSYIHQEDDFLSKEECNQIIQFNTKFSRSLSGTESVFLEYDNKSYRNSYNYFLKYDKNIDFSKNLYQKIFNKILEINTRYFDFILTDVERFQITRYELNNYYKKHIDNFEFLNIGKTERKLSFSIQLSEFDSYTGGDLNLYISENVLSFSRKIGSIIFFPSFLLHEVTPVTLGTRFSLVGWIWGPKFK